MFFIRLNSTLVITSHTLKNVEKTHYDTIRVCYGNNEVAEYQCRGYADKAFAKLLDTMSATEALTVATIINEAPVPPGMFVSKELPPRVSGEDLVIDVEGILRSVKKGGMLRRTQGELKRRLEEQILIQAVFLYSLL